MADGMAIVDVAFRVLGVRPDRTYEWQFDDDTSEKGTSIRHCFFRTSMRTVRLVQSSPTGTEGELVRKVRVHPLWSQPHEWPSALFEQQKAKIIAWDLSSLSLDDLVSLLQYVTQIKDRQLLTRVGSVCLDRRQEFPSDTDHLFRELALHFEHPQVRLYQQAEKAYRAAYHLCPTSYEYGDRRKVELADFLLRYTNGVEEAGRLLAGEGSPSSGQAERRRLICEGDLLLARGFVKQARDKYRAAGTVAGRDARAYVARRRAHLEIAKTFTDQGEYDAAADIAIRIEWEAPLARLNTEAGLVMVRAHIGREEYRFALTRCERLLKLASMDRNRAEILFHLIEVHRAMGATGKAKEVFDRLTEDHPYSETTARAIEQWGADFPSTK